MYDDTKDQQVKELYLWAHSEDACDSALEWLRWQPSIEHAWYNCPRADWLTWLLDGLYYEDATLKRRMFLYAAETTTLVDDSPWLNLLMPGDRGFWLESMSRAIDTGQYTDDLWDLRQLFRKAEYHPSANGAACVGARLALIGIDHSGMLGFLASSVAYHAAYYNGSSKWRSWVFDAQVEMQNVRLAPVIRRFVPFSDVYDLLLAKVLI